MNIEKALALCEAWVTDPRQSATPWLPAAVLALINEVRRLRAMEAIRARS